MPSPTIDQIIIDCGTSLVNTYHDKQGDYLSTFETYALNGLNFARNNNLKGGDYLYHMIKTNQIENLGKLLLMQIYICCNDSNLTPDKLVQYFAVKSGNFLIKNGIPEQYVWHNNLQLTKEFADAIQNFENAYTETSPSNNYNNSYKHNSGCMLLIIILTSFSYFIYNML